MESPTDQTRSIKKKHCDIVTRVIIIINTNIFVIHNIIVHIDAQVPCNFCENIVVSFMIVFLIANKNLTSNLASGGRREVRGEERM